MDTPTMGLPCDCGCVTNAYNVRKIRISDGRTIWRKLVTHDVVTNEVQRLRQTGTTTTNTFKLTYQGQETVAIPDGASAAAVQAALEALSTIGVGNVSCEGTANVDNGVYITFLGDLSGIDLPLITVTEHPEQYFLGVVTNGSTVVLNRANDCAYLSSAGCGDAGKLVVGIGPSDEAVPNGLSATSGNIIWTMPDDRLASPELDSNAEGNWIGIFSRPNPDPPEEGLYYYNPLGLIAVADQNKRRAWSNLMTRTPVRCAAKFGNETYFAAAYGLASATSFDGGRLEYGDSLQGYQTYLFPLNVNDLGLPHVQAITNIFGISEEIAIVEVTWFGIGEEVYDISPRLWDLAARDFAMPGTPVPSGVEGDAGNVSDAAWHRRNGTPEFFYCLTSADNVHLFNVLTGLHDSLNDSGLLRIKTNQPNSEWRMLPTGTRPAKLWLCSDGIVVVCGESSFSINGKTCEIFKCDFDLNLIWTRRWRGVGSGNALRGISGDADHVYVSGDPGSWSAGDV